MAHYLLLLHEKPGDLAGLGHDEILTIIAKYSAWADRLRQEGRLIGSEKLRDDGGKILRRRGPETVVADGPYGEASEVVAGYLVIRAGDYAEAVEIAKGCPHTEFGAIEIREIEPIH